MYLFDCVEERKEIDGSFDVYAIDRLNNQIYLLRNAIINTSSNVIDGFTLSISCDPEKYVYRGSFNTESEMNAFTENIARLLDNAIRKNRRF